MTGAKPFGKRYIGSRAIEIRSASGTRFAGIVSIKEYAPHTAAGIMDAFLQLPFELVIAQSFEFERTASRLMEMRSKDYLTARRHDSEAMKAIRET